MFADVFGISSRQIQKVFIKTAETCLRYQPHRSQQSMNADLAAGTCPCVAVMVLKTKSKTLKMLAAFVPSQKACYAYWTDRASIIAYAKVNAGALIPYSDATWCDKI